MDVVKGSLGVTESEAKEYFHSVIDSLRNNGWSFRKNEKHLVKGDTKIVFDHFELPVGYDSYDGNLLNAVFCLNKPPSFAPGLIADRSINNF